MMIRGVITSIERYNFCYPAFFTVIMSILIISVFLSACSNQKAVYPKKRYIIVIDPGYGARNSNEGVLKGKITESEINLMKAKRLAHYINRNNKFLAMLTRNDDAYVPLDKRGEFPNKYNADIFISLQTMFGDNRNSYEIGTYCLGTVSDEKALRTAVNANHTTSRNIHDLEAIINDLMDEDLNHRSCELAGRLQESMVQNLRPNGRIEIKNEGTGKAPFYVLIGTKMPSVLIETSHFVDLTNDKKNEYMPNWDYVCEGLIEGIELYIEKK